MKYRSVYRKACIQCIQSRMLGEILARTTGNLATELREAKISTAVFTSACGFHQASWLLEHHFFVLDSKENCFLH